MIPKTGRKTFVFKPTLQQARRAVPTRLRLTLAEQSQMPRFASRINPVFGRNAMKLFFTVFAAILAAAVVIWGVKSFREELKTAAYAEKEKIREQELESQRPEALLLSELKLMTTKAKSSSEAVISGGKISVSTLKSGYDDARTLERYLREQKFSGPVAHKLIYDFVFEYQWLTKTAREKHMENENLQLLDDMEWMLNKIDERLSGV